MIQATFLLLDRVNEPLLDEGSWYASDSVSEEITDSSTGERIKQAVKKAVSVIKRESIKQDEFHLDVLPYFHCYALLMGFIALHTGTPRVILPRFQLDVFLSAVQDHKITFAFVVPPIRESYSRQYTFRAKSFTDSDSSATQCLRWPSRPRWKSTMSARSSVLPLVRLACPKNFRLLSISG